MYKPKYVVGQIYTDNQGNKLHVTRNDPKELYGQRVWYRDEGTMTHFACSEKEFTKLINTKISSVAKAEPKPTRAEENKRKAEFSKAMSKEKAAEKEKEKKEIIAESKKKEKKIKKVTPKKNG